MKRIIALLMVAVLGISLCACGESTNSGQDKENQLRDQIGQLEDAYDRAKENAVQFRQDVDDYYDALDELEKYN